MNNNSRIFIENYLPKFCLWNSLSLNWRKTLIAYVDFNGSNRLNFQYVTGYIQSGEYPDLSAFEIYQVEDGNEKDILYGELEMLTFFDRLDNLRTFDISRIYLDQGEHLCDLSLLSNLEILILKGKSVNSLKGIGELLVLKNLDIRETKIIL
ncbi:hypothetical protein [Aquipluma nitroreducens]|uniref:hypothetical protein n=1 Tax=Aquipluma nitroreducens TaxID=2010828 RepID=UPI00296FCB18|nr:hypothetical protein [Aquipluma nitroreducens]